MAYYLFLGNTHFKPEAILAHPHLADISARGVVFRFFYLRVALDILMDLFTFERAKFYGV
jgi:hypothetical protein